MKRMFLRNFAHQAAIFAAVVLITGSALGQSRPDFSGTYRLSAVKGDPAVNEHKNLGLKVVQTDTEIVITHQFIGHESESRLKLNGSEGNFTSPGALWRGYGKVKFKRNDLIINATVQFRDGLQFKEITYHEEWSLSPDRKTLTIHRETRQSDVPELALVGDETYTRE
ncbi:MAG: hypothetical protein ACRD3E_18960 [Terriglobales bacterium]